MFAMTIIDSDAFLDMPLSAQALYFHLCMRADDDGFLNNPKKIQRVIGASEKDLEQLVERRFLIAFPSGVVVIKHWRMHNYIKKDRYKPTVYTAERQLLTVKENNAYTEIQQSVSTLEPECIQSGYGLDSQVRVRLELGKDRLDNTSCPEVSQEAETIETEATQIFIELPAIGSPSQPKKTHKVTEQDVEKYHEIYPAVDIRQELRQMAMWLEANPSRKKSNTKAFIVNWLKKAQDQSGSSKQQQQRQGGYIQGKSQIPGSVMRTNDAFAGRKSGQIDF
jgi:hypothetical protein